jgi:hypothetical protein
MAFPLYRLFILILFVIGFVVLMAFLLCRHGKSVGEKEGYIRGFKEGQQTNIVRK